MRKKKSSIKLIESFSLTASPFFVMKIFTFAYILCELHKEKRIFCRIKTDAIYWSSINLHKDSNSKQIKNNSLARKLLINKKFVPSSTASSSKHYSCKTIFWAQIYKSNYDKNNILRRGMLIFCAYRERHSCWRKNYAKKLDVQHLIIN